MHHPHHIYSILDFLNNATFAGVITISLGGLFGLWIYSRQKKVDRHYSAQEKISESLMLLIEHCKTVNNSLNRLVRTFAHVTESKDSERVKSFIEDSVPYETRILGEVLMYQIPEDISNIESMITLYFNDNQSLKEAHADIFNKLKIWHDFIGEKGFGKGDFPITKQVPEIPELSLDALTISVKNFIVILKNISFSSS